MTIPAQWCIIKLMLDLFKKGLIRLLCSRGYCVSFGEPATLAGILSAFGSRKKEFFFVQIGAYDGLESDPIQASVRESRWTGILVEPQPDAFENLKRNYANVPNLVFENVAIAASQGVLPLYKLRDEFAHLFHGDHRMLSSFDSEHIMKHLSERVDVGVALETFHVPCLTLSSLLAKHAVQKIDLLQIDAEGYDYEILKLVDFGQAKPTIIHFEHAHLGPLEKGECIQLLVSHGYKVVTGAYDMIAFQSRWMYN
jgi:FkbM family methyltransferase